MSIAEETEADDTIAVECEIEQAEDPEEVVKEDQEAKEEEEEVKEAPEEDVDEEIPENITGEVEVVIHPHEEDSQDDILDLGESGLEAVTDDDPGYEIVTEDKGTNCPSLSGSLRKQPKKKASMKDEVVVVVAEDIKEDSSDRSGKSEESKPHAAMKKWSKLMKYTLPSKNPESKQNKKSKERKSLRDKMKDTDLVAFLTERRAVSESRFRVLDRLGPAPQLARTQSQQSLEESWATGITQGAITQLKQKFEGDEEIIFSLQSPVVVRDATSSTGDLGNQQPQQQEPAEGAETEKVETEADSGAVINSSAGSSVKINETPQDSGNDEKKKDKKGKKKDKKKCDVCTSDKEHREHRREKRRIKKEKQEKKREKETVSSKDQGAKESSTPASEPRPPVPPLPAPASVSGVPQSKVTGDNFFQKLLMKDETQILQKYNRVERASRPVKKDKKYVFQPSEPAMGKYLKGKKAVSESKFKQFEEFEKFVERSLLPRGIIKCEEFNEKKSVFEQPRSVSVLAGRVSPRHVSGERERPVSVMSNRSASGDRRCFSLPRDRPGSALSQRPGSALSQASTSSYMIDQQEYRNYVYEMVNSAPKNPRFNQLTQYFSTLERVTRLESESSSMEVHKLKSDDIVDFETWRQLRKQEKAKDELDELLLDLRKAQKEREFHFRPKEVDSVRWSGDSRLRGRDKSVENLKNLFAQKAAAPAEQQNSTKDVYKLYWRPRSVTDLTKESDQPPPATGSQSLRRGGGGEQSSSRAEARFTTYPKSRHVQSPYNAANVLLSQRARSRSSLSSDQVTIKNVFE